MLCISEFSFFAIFTTSDKEYSSPNSNEDEWILNKENKKSKGKKCPLCGTLNDNDAIYCKVCGEELNNKF